MANKNNGNNSLKAIVVIMWAIGFTTLLAMGNIFTAIVWFVGSVLIAGAFLGTHGK